MAQKSGKINGAQETKGCREVKGQEEDEQCVGKISQLVRKFIGYNFTTYEISQVPKIRKLGNFILL